MDGFFFGEGSVDVEVGCVDLEGVSGDSDEAFDVVGAALLAGHAVTGAVGVDAAGVEDEGFAAGGLAEVVGDFIDEDEVTGGEAALEDGVAGAVVDAGAEVFTGAIEEGFADGGDAHDLVLGGTNGDDAAIAHGEFGAGEEEPAAIVNGADAQVSFGDDVLVAFTFDDALGDALAEPGHFPVFFFVLGLGDDAVEGGLHGPGGDAEGLDEVGADAEGDDDGDPEDFDVFLDGVGGAVVGEGFFADVADLFGGFLDGVEVLLFDGGFEIGAA